MGVKVCVQEKIVAEKFSIGKLVKKVGAGKLSENFYIKKLLIKQAKWKDSEEQKTKSKSFRVIYE